MYKGIMLYDKLPWLLYNPTRVKGTYHCNSLIMATPNAPTEKPN
jgi:hypothetical protein